MASHSAWCTNTVAGAPHPHKHRHSVEYFLVAFNNPSAVRVYRINKDFSQGELRPGPVDAGIFAHQVRTTPDDRLAILVTRGNEGTPTKDEDPGR